MFSDISKVLIIFVFLALSIFLLLTKILKIRFPYRSYINYLWTFFLIFAASEAISFGKAIWILAVLCFMALREYFTLVDIRLQDRWGILGAYLSIPFMIIFIQFDYYGMFIISIPVYAFLVIPFLVTLGGKEIKGTLLSIGIIDLGLFLLVFCIGHIGYLALFSTWWAIMLILNVAICDLISILMRKRKNHRWINVLTQYFVSAPFTIILTLGLSNWTGIPWLHSIFLGILIPILVAIGRHTIRYIEKDLGISRNQLLPGKGQVIDNLRSFLYAAPVIFHYLRFFSMRSDAF
ncbi:MAG: phosphatidate cytidylyltransferase [Candidatus Hodarchaeota archaeon]